MTFASKTASMWAGEAEGRRRGGGGRGRGERAGGVLSKTPCQ